MQTKSSLRKILLEKRRDVTAAERQRAGEQALKLLQHSDVISAGSIVGAYWPMADEFDVQPLIRWLHADNITCALPCVTARDKPLLFRRYAKGDALAMHHFFNIPQPDESTPVLEPDIILVPLVGFDRRGYRIGMGGGFYDRTLHQHHAKTIGIGYAVTEIAQVPHESHDVRLSAILTERELLEIEL